MFRGFIFQTIKTYSRVSMWFDPHITTVYTYTRYKITFYFLIHSFIVCGAITLSPVICLRKIPSMTGKGLIMNTISLFIQSQEFIKASSLIVEISF